MKNHIAFYCIIFLLFPLVSQSQKIESLDIDNERTQWGSFLASDTTSELNDNPNALLIETVKQLIPGKALDLGMGLGRNSIYLAMNGWDVTGVNIADDALAFGHAEASKNKANIGAIVSAKPYDFGINEWDLIVHVYKGCLTDSRISRISNALKPGGMLVFEFFHREAGIEMKKPTFGCETNSTKRAIEQAGGFKILRYSEEVGIDDYDLQNYKLVKLVAAKK
ncbi:MAG TPA: methyltransferase domain-containing protein [Cyclobacteriaceae bacterium]|jgi:SAM-dependent methyltransferase|nr:methyltransferase domain-containing protein [Cyclobacteriaceae bacterium]